MTVELPEFSDPRDRAIWVHARLRQLNLSFAKLARTHGYGPGTVSAALYTPMVRQEKIIADAIGVSQERLFPERYAANGERLYRVLKSKKDAA